MTVAFATQRTCDPPCSQFELAELDGALRPLVAALLLEHLALDPDGPLDLGARLRRYGIHTTAEQRHDATKWCNRRGIATRGEKGHEGIYVLGWTVRFRRRRRRHRRRGDNPAQMTIWDLE